MWNPRRLSSCLAIAASMLLACVGVASAQDEERLTPAQAREYIALTPDLFLLDVRTPKEFEAGHPESARNIPLRELKGRLHEVPTDKPLLIYCQTGNRAESAYRILRKERPDQSINVVTGGTLGEP